MSRIFIVFLGLVFIFSACKKNSTDPVEMFNYLPLTFGSNWVYERWESDINKQNIGEEIFLDSMAVTGKVTKSDKIASVFNEFEYDVFQNAYASTAESYYYNDDRALYAYSTLIANAMGGMLANVLRIEDQWLKVFDTNSEMWRVLKRDYTAQDPLVFFGFNIVGTLDVMGEILNNITEVNTPAGRFNVKAVGLEFKFNGTISALGQTLPLNFKNEWVLSFAKDVGIVERFVKPTTISVPFVGEIPVEGEYSVLKKFQIIQ